MHGFRKKKVWLPSRKEKGGKFTKFAEIAGWEKKKKTTGHTPSNRKNHTHLFLQFLKIKNLEGGS